MQRSESNKATSGRKNEVAMNTTEEMEAGKRTLARRQGRTVTNSETSAVTYAAQRSAPGAPKTEGVKSPSMPYPPGETTYSPIVAASPSELGQPANTKREEPPGEQQQTPSPADENGGPVSETANDGIAQFMARVVPWPEGDAAPGYVNVHWTIPQPTGKPRWTGKPVRSIAELQSLVKWVLSRPNAGDIYYCLSLQSKAGVNKRGNPVAERSLQNALAVKALWLDIDVKEPPKGYATVQEAWAALKGFYRVVGLPRPSAMVASGGGLHVYWISRAPLTLDQWRPLAVGLKNAALKHGLRCDACCTVDAARILRVPGTWNCKTEPKRPVQLLWLGDDYDF
jgi:hypothetical protein